MEALPIHVPFVGRRTELRYLRGLLAQAEEGAGGTLFIRGPGGAGKSRLARVAAHEAGEKGWQVAEGRAFPVGTGVPYAVFTDALTPLVSGLDPETLTVLTRGREEELFTLLPNLGPPGEESVRTAGMTPAEVRTRLHWNMGEFLGRLAERKSLLLVVEDLQWADDSSLELLHFLARQAPESGLLILGVYRDEEMDEAGPLASTVRSLTSMDVAEVLRLDPLSEEDTMALVRHTFDVPETVAEPFARELYDWTRGNPFFLVEVLKDLVESGRLRREGGVWIGWETRNLELPRTVRETLAARFARLSDPGRRVADIAAVMGSRARHDVLRRVSELGEDRILEALDELRDQLILQERDDEQVILYEFTHPLLRESLYGELGRARARRLHGAVGRAVEEVHGEKAPERADELAYHFNRALEADLAPRAVKYLTLAGRTALSRHANREARSYLQAALERVEEDPEAGGGLDLGDLRADLARACQRLGDFDAAVELLEAAREEARAGGASLKVAELERRLGLAFYWSGRRVRALERYDAGLEAAGSTEGGGGQRTRLRLARGVCLQELGRPREARETLERALKEARDEDAPALLARVHRALLTLHTWTGPPEVARDHGETAAELAERAEARELLWAVDWSRAVFEGLSGDGEATRTHLRRCQELAEELHSPLRALWTSEVALEFLSATGEWDKALAMGETNIRLARNLGQTTLLPRLLVSTALVHLGRGDTERAEAYVDEAWELSGAGHEDRGSRNIHAVVPAHMGRAACYRSTGEYEKAIEVGERGLAVAEEVGYLAWGIHRLLPVIVESYLELRDLEGAQRMGSRLRGFSEHMGHRLGIAWADATDALVAWLDGDPERAVDLLREAAEALEAVPFTYDAARVRRQLAGRLAETGERDAAISELRRIHDVFDRLGAEPELAKTRDQLREVGARPPVRTEGGGTGALTSRELEIARLVAQRMSNKRIGKELGISPRTVSTHLSNIYKKVEISSRGELADRVREGIWPRT